MFFFISLSKLSLQTENPFIVITYVKQNSPQSYMLFIILFFILNKAKQNSNHVTAALNFFKIISFYIICLLSIKFQ